MVSEHNAADRSVNDARTSFSGSDTVVQRPQAFAGDWADRCAVVSFFASRLGYSEQVVSARVAAMKAEPGRTRKDSAWRKWVKAHPGEACLSNDPLTSANFLAANALRSGSASGGVTYKTATNDLSAISKVLQFLYPYGSGQKSNAIAAVTKTVKQLRPTRGFDSKAWRVWTSNRYN